MSSSIYISILIYYIYHIYIGLSHFQPNQMREKPWMRKPSMKSMIHFIGYFLVVHESSTGWLPSPRLTAKQPSKMMGLEDLSGIAEWLKVQAASLFCSGICNEAIAFTLTIPQLKRSGGMPWIIFLSRHMAAVLRNLQRNPVDGRHTDLCRI